MEDYYIQFQVWRPNGSGCYSLVGFNRPVNSNGVLNPGNPLRRCVVLSVIEEDQQIEVLSGDVVGYYVDHDNDNQTNNGGIQWLENHNNVVVHYKDDLPRGDIKSHYALNGTHPSSCGFPSDDSNSYSLSSATSAAPIISLSFGRCRPVIYTCYI